MTMKKLLLLIALILGGVTFCEATQKVVFKGAAKTGKWANIRIDKASFSDLKSGDVIWLQTENDVNAAIAAEEEWYQLTVDITTAESWTHLVVAKNVAQVGYWAYSPTNEQITKIKENGLAISGHFIIAKELGYGDATSTAIQHWGDSDWTTDGFSIGSWTSVTLNNANLSEAKVGDFITVNYTTSATAEWDTRVVLYDAQTAEWTTIYDFPGGLSTSISFPVTEDNLSLITTGDIRLGGLNYTVTSLTINKVGDMRYLLSAGNTSVDLESLPATAIDVELYRKFDWNTTLCVPFNIASVATTFGDKAKAYEITSYNTDIVFTERESIKAGVPYLMTFDMSGYDEAAKTYSVNIDDVTINTTLNNATAGSLTFKGNYTPDMDMAGKYGMACRQYGEDWVWAFYKGSTGSKLNAFSAYIESTTSAPKLSFSFGDEEGTTDIREKVIVNNEGFATAPVYNLNGQRVTNPTKGLYIINGRKVVIK